MITYNYNEQWVFITYWVCVSYLLKSVKTIQFYLKIINRSYSFKIPPILFHNINKQLKIIGYIQTFEKIILINQKIN